MDDFSTPNKLNMFNLKPSEANYIKPLKRPMSRQENFSYHIHNCSMKNKIFIL